MKKFFSRNGIWILAAAAIVAVVLSVMASIGSGTGFVRNAAGVIASPFRSAGSAVAGWVSDIADHFASVEALQAENEELRRQNAALQEQVRQSQADSEENARLRRVLQLRQQHADFALESAMIVDRAASNWERSFTVNKGTSCGVATGNCVVDPYGNLVGVVTDAGTNWSSVTAITDTGSEIGATVFRTHSPGVAAGELQLMTEGRLMLTYLSETDGLINGDLAVTSGLGGFYPAGLPIGTVEEVRTDDSGLVRYAVLFPKMQLDTLVEVFIITDFTVVE